MIILNAYRQETWKLGSSEFQSRVIFKLVKAIFFLSAEAQRLGRLSRKSWVFYEHNNCLWSIGLMFECSGSCTAGNGVMRVSHGCISLVLDWEDGAYLVSLALVRDEKIFIEWEAQSNQIWISIILYKANDNESTVSYNIWSLSSLYLFPIQYCQDIHFSHLYTCLPSRSSGWCTQSLLSFCPHKNPLN